MKILNIETEAPMTPCRRNLFALTALLVLILSIYSNTFYGEWQFDDYQNIVNRKEIQITKFCWEEIKKTVFIDRFGESIYRPVANFTLALNYYFHKTDVFGYHLVNIFVHICAAFFLFLLIYDTLNLPLLRPRYGNHAYMIALLSTVLWAINPVQTQAVSYVVQRMASMAAMFSIMAMYFYVRGRTSKGRSVKAIHFSMCAMSALLAFGSKENTVMLPFCILLFDLFLIQGITRKNIKRSACVFLGLILLPLVFVLLLRGPVVFDIEKVLSNYDALRPFSFMERVLTEPRIILFYLSLLFYPMPDRLCFTHDIDISRSLIDPLSTLIAILVILVILVLCIISAKRRPFISYCILFFFLNHLVEGSFIALELFFEHRNYLPSIFLFTPLAILFVNGLHYFKSRHSMQVIIAFFFILLLVGWGNSTFERNFVWQTEMSLWKDAKNKFPALIRPYLKIAQCYFEKGLFEKALSENLEGTSKKILSNKNDYILINYNTGLTYQKLGQLDNALEYYNKAAEQNPRLPGLYNNIGLVLLEKGQTEGAKQEFKRAIRFDKDYIRGYRNLSKILLKEGQIDEALSYLNGALRIDPNDVASLGRSGYVYRLKGRFDRAFGLFEKALCFEAHDEKTHLYIAEIFFKRRMEAQAIKHIIKFTEKGIDADLRGYMEGIYKHEDAFDVIRPYKKLVLETLSGCTETRPPTGRKSEGFKR